MLSEMPAQRFDEETRMDGEDAGRPYSDLVGLGAFGMRDV